MSQKDILENLLIDFSNIIADDQFSEDDRAKQTTISTESISANKQAGESMPFLCSSEPLYKLLSTESDHIEDNNPFDHMDKKVGRLHDPFELVENAALVSFDASENGTSMVETGTLISIDSPVNVKIMRADDFYPKAECDRSKTALPSSDVRNSILSETKSNDSVQNTSQKQFSNSKNASQKSLVSPSGKSRCKAKNTSLNLLKYSLSNSRLDLAAESGSQSEENLCASDTSQMRQKSRRDSGTDDSFDDIWATKPNLIDSQTDIDVDSDLDNDIAKLNIPMLNHSMHASKHVENMSSNADEKASEESTEEKAANRNEILEKFASIKQKIPQSPMTMNTSTIPVHNQTVNIKVQENSELENEPVTPKSQYSSVVVQKEQLPCDNPNSLIENLKKLVDQCDDKSKQNTAKHLLDDLKSILSTDASESIESLKNPIKKPIPQLIKRQGTFSLEKSKLNDKYETSEDYFSREETKTENKNNATNDPSLSQVVKNIQNVLGSQNINVLQTKEQSMSSSSSNNPTYIVVMAQSMADYKDDIICGPHRIRSQSLTLKEKPLAAIRANQHKIEQTQIQPNVATPTKRPVLQRRSSFGTIARTASNRENEVQNKPSHPVAKPDASKVVRRRSFQGQNQAVQSMPSNPVSRRRSFQGTCTTSGIRSPSPKTSINATDRSTISHRLSSNTNATITRRKSFSTGIATDSPTKLKSSYGIIKKPAPPTAARNLKIRVSQSTSGRSTAPLRAVVPMNRVASLLLINETVSPVNDNKGSTPITSTPRSVSSLSPAKSKKGLITGPKNLPEESPIQKDSTYLSMTPSKPVVKPTNGNAIQNTIQRRRSLSDYQTELNSSVTVNLNSGGKAVSSIKNATNKLTSGLSKFTAKRISSIGLKRPSGGILKENKYP